MWFYSNTIGVKSGAETINPSEFTPGFYEVPVAQSLCKCFVDYYLSFLSFGHCVVCPSTYGY